MRRRFRRCLRPAISALLVVSFSMPWTAAAQTQQPRLFDLTAFSGALTFQYQVTSEEESSLESVYRDLNRKYLEGGIQLSTEGSIYHPNLLSFRADANILGHRTKNLQFSDSSINNAVNNTYNINISFLKKKKFNLQLYALRNFSTSDRAFHDRYFTTYRSLGATLVSRAKFLPFRIEAYSANVKSDSLSFTDRNEKSKHLDAEVGILEKDRLRSTLTLRSKDYSESTFDIGYKSLDIMGNFIYNFGYQQRSLVSTVATYHKMTGDSDLETFQVNTNGVYYMTPNLDFRAAYSLNIDNSFQREYVKHEITGTLSHKLYQSLITSVQAGGRKETSVFQDVDTFQRQFGFNYIKRIPRGSIQLSYMNRQNNSNYRSKSPIVIESEVFDFSLSDSIILTRQGINIDSIRVTAEDLSQLYVAGVDYRVEQLGNIVSITRLPGGAIPPESSVTVHFEYLSYPDYDLKLRFYQFNARLNVFKYFHFYYRRFSNDQTITSDYTITPYEDYTKEVIGTQLISRYFRAEYNRERYDSTLSDYVSRNYRLAANVKPFRFLRLSGNITINRLKYVPETFFSHLDAYSAECAFFPMKNLTANTVYRKITYTTPTYVRERESVILKAEYSIRKIIVSLFYEHILTGYENTQRLHDYFSLMIRRTF